MSRIDLLVTLALVAAVIAGGSLWQRSIQNDFSVRPYVDDRIQFDTYIRIKAFGKNGKKVRAAVEATFARIAELDKLMNYHSQTAEISKLNSLAPGEKIRLSADLYGVLSLSQAYFQATGGAFDPSIGRLMDLWDFGDGGDVPEAAQLSHALSRANFDAVALSKAGQTLTFAEPGVKIDLGGVAKGYALDQAARTLKKRGVSRALISAGSVTKLVGTKPGQRDWKVGIKHPRSDDNRLLGTLTLKSRAVSTSGDYQQFFEVDGTRFHHILDPATGQPARGAISVTVITRASAAVADILSTAVFVMGPEQGLQFLENTPDAEGIIVTETGQTLFSTGAPSYFQAE
ncbi:MAG: FAD:protein FMN transferase [Terriglobia bacterium]